jgi:hypothetical protein
MNGHHRILGKDEACARPRKTGKDQPGHHGEETHAGEDFDRGDEMPISGLRMHVAIADRGERFDREVKEFERLIAGDVGDRFVAEPIEKCEHRIKYDENERRRTEEGRPIDRHRAVIEIGPEAVGEAAGFDFATAYANEMPSAFLSELDLFWKFRQSG